MKNTHLTALPATPPSSLLFFRRGSDALPPAADRMSGLIQLLDTSGIQIDEVLGALEEYAFRSMHLGKRVRECCQDLASIVERVVDSTFLREAFTFEHINLLFPFINLSLNPYLPAATPATGPSLLSPSVVASLSRKQVVGALVKLSKDLVAGRTGSDDIEVLVIEICLEYIACRWRGGTEKGDKPEEGVLGGIARHLLEVQLEVQLQGVLSTVRSAILPPIQKIRCQLGLMSLPNLIRLFDRSSSNPSMSPSHPPDPRGLISAWIARRLSMGVDPLRIVDDIENEMETLAYEEIRRAAGEALKAFGLSTRDRMSDPQPLLVTTATLPSFTTGDITSTSFTPSLGWRRKSKAFFSGKVAYHRPIPAPPSWIRHHSGNSSSRLHLPSFNADRRPSLPISSSPSALPPVIAPWSSRSHVSSTTLASSTGSNRRASGSSFTRQSSNNLLSSLMAFSEPEDIRSILHDYLLSRRYIVVGEPGDDWFLGGGKQSADEVISGIESKLVGQKDVMGLRSIFVDLRSRFHLPQNPAVESPFGSKAEQRVQRASLISQFPPVPKRTTTSPVYRHERDVSFDLHEYLHDISNHQPLARGEETFDEMEDHTVVAAGLRPPPFPDKAKRASVGAESMLTMRTYLTGDSLMSGRESRNTLRGTFTIQEARREWPLQAAAMVHSLPKRSHSLRTLPIFHIDDPIVQQIDSPRSLRRRSVSQPGLLRQAVDSMALGGGSLRRRERIDLTSTNLSADDLGLALPSTPTFPPAPMSVSFLPTTPSQLDIQMSSGRVASYSTPLTPPPEHSISLSRFSYPDLPQTDKSRRRLYRQFAIVDGEHVSPSRSLIPFESPSSTATAWSEIDTPPSTPRVPARSTSLRRPSDGDRSPLELVMSLFAASDTRHQTRARSDLTTDEVQTVLRSAVEAERGRNRGHGQRCGASSSEHLVWLIRQVRDILDPRFRSAIEQTIDHLSASPDLPFDDRPPSHALHTADRARGSTAPLISLEQTFLPTLATPPIKVAHRTTAVDLMVGAPIRPRQQRGRSAASTDTFGVHWADDQAAEAESF